MAEYHRVQPRVHEPLDRVDVRVPVPDATAAFTRVPTAGPVFDIDASGWFPHSTPHGRGGSRNPEVRVRGVQRKGSKLLISASDPDAAILMIASLVTDASGVPRGGNIEQICTLDHRLRHTGGIQRAGNLLSIPLEGRGVDARVLFLEISNPLEPRVITGGTVFRSDVKARATAITTLPDGRLLLGVLSSQRRWFGLFGARPVLDVYLSRTDDISDGFGDPCAIALAPRARYQAISFAFNSTHAELVRGCMIGLDAAGHADFLPMEIWPPPQGGFWPREGTAGFASSPLTKTLEVPSSMSQITAAGIAIEDDGEFAFYAGQTVAGADRFRFSVFRSNS